jgi:hypothetical protein
MTHGDIIEVRCPRCGHTFKVDPATTGEEQIIYKGETAERQYRLRCPVDHTFFVVTVPPADQIRPPEETT